MTSMAIDNEEMAKNLKKRSDGAIIFSATNNNNNNDDNDYNNNNNNNNSSSSSSSSENIVSKSKNRMKKVKQIPSVTHCPRCNEKHDILYGKITLCNNCQNIQDARKQEVEEERTKNKLTKEEKKENAKRRSAEYC